ncbi:unnamed protein product [Trichobilharzia szidati]|nr:unnamed protein product [Trichobilharzia szidati]
MEWPKFYPSRIPLFAAIHAFFWLPVMYFIATYYDHVQPVVPYVSAFGLYPPEKYMFMYSSLLFGALIIISQWFWYLMMRRRLAERNACSPVGGLLCIMVPINLTISGISIIALSLIDAKTHNFIHYCFSLLNFYGHIVSNPLGALLVLYSFRPRKWFFLARLIVWIQMILGAYFFIYYNKIGLPILKAKDFYYIKPHEPGYEEFKWSAVCEWIVVLGCLEIELITSLELRHYEKRTVDRIRRSTRSRRF